MLNFLRSVAWLLIIAFFSSGIISASAADIEVTMPGHSTAYGGPVTIRIPMATNNRSCQPTGGCGSYQPSSPEDPDAHMGRTHKSGQGLQESQLTGADYAEFMAAVITLPIWTIEGFIDKIREKKVQQKRQQRLARAERKRVETIVSRWQRRAIQTTARLQMEAVASLRKIREIYTGFEDKADRNRRYKLQRAIDQASRLRAGGKACNQFAQTVAHFYGIRELSPWANATKAHKPKWVLADKILERVRKSSSTWKKVDSSEATNLAKDGHVVLGLGQGHVAVVAPVDPFPHWTHGPIPRVRSESIKTITSGWGPNVTGCRRARDTRATARASCHFNYNARHLPEWYLYIGPLEPSLGPPPAVGEKR